MFAQLLEPVFNVATRLRGREYIGGLYQQLHGEGKFKGVTWRAHLEDFRRAVPNLASKRILDYGCGPRGGLAEEFGENVISHDPYVERYAALPWQQKFDVVFSSDVLEHMPLLECSQFLQRVRTSQAEHVFLVISTRRASKRLPNGANAHLTVKSADWWLSFLQDGLSAEFTPTLALSNLLRQVAVCCFQRNS